MGYSLVYPIAVERIDDVPSNSRFLGDPCPSGVDLEGCVHLKISEITPDDSLDFELSKWLYEFQSNLTGTRSAADEFTPLLNSLYDEVDRMYRLWSEMKLAATVPGSNCPDPQKISSCFQSLKQLLVAYVLNNKDLQAIIALEADTNRTVRNVPQRQIDRILWMIQKIQRIIELPDGSSLALINATIWYGH